MIGRRNVKLKKALKKALQSFGRIRLGTEFASDDVRNLPHLLEDRRPLLL